MKNKIVFVLALLMVMVLTCLVITAGLKIEDLKAELAANDLLISRMECEKEILQYDVDRFLAAYDSKEQELYDAENTFVDYMVGLTSRLAGQELTEEDITEEYFEELITDLISRPKTVEVIKEVEKIVYVDKIVTENVTVELKDFKTEQELEAFLAADTTDEIPAVWNLDGTFIHFWCFAYSEILRDSMQEAGYHANIQVFPSGALPMSDRKLDAAHAMVNVRVGDDVWLVEPQTDECWLAWGIHLMEVD